MLILGGDLLEKLIAHSRAALPNEACGLIAGVIDGEGVKKAGEVYCLKNIDESPEHFSMSVEEQFAAVADMRGRGIVLLGNFHSHPSTPARPSEEDIRLAFDRSLSYLIVSLAGHKPVLKSFIIDKNEHSVTEERLIPPVGSNTPPLAAVRTGNINKKLVVDPHYYKFPYGTNRVNNATLTRYPAALRRGGSFRGVSPANLAHNSSRQEFKKKTQRSLRTRRGKKRKK